MIPYLRHYEAIGDGMIQGHVTPTTPRYAVPAAFLSQVPGMKLRLVDVGCGDGDIARRVSLLPRVESLVLADVSFPTVSKASRWYGLPGVVAWGEAVPFRDDSFDVALLIAVLEHALMPQEVVREAERVARWIIAVVPAVPDQDPDHIRLFDLKGLALSRGGVAKTDGKEWFALWETQKRSPAILVAGTPHG